MHHALRFGSVLTVGFATVLGLAAPGNASPANSSTSAKAGSKTPSSTKNAKAMSTKTKSPFLSAKEFRALTPDQQAKYIGLLRKWMVGIEEAQNRLSNSEVKSAQGKKAAQGPTLISRDIASIFELFYASMSQAEAYQSGEECINGGFFSEWVLVKLQAGGQKLLCSSSKAKLEGDLTKGSCGKGTSKCAGIPYGFKDASYAPICVPTSAKLSQSCMEQAQDPTDTVKQLLKINSFDGNFDKLKASLEGYMQRLADMTIPDSDTAFQKEARQFALDRTQELINALEILKAASKPAPPPAPPQTQPAPPAPCTAQGASNPQPGKPCNTELPAPPPAPQPEPPKDKELLGKSLSCVYRGLESKFPKDLPSEKYLALLGVAAQQFDGPFNLDDPKQLEEFRKSVIKMVQAYGYCSEDAYKTTNETTATKDDIRGWLNNEKKLAKNNENEIYLEGALKRLGDSSGYTGRNSFMAIFGLSPEKRDFLRSHSDLAHFFRPVDKSTWDKMSLAEKQQNWVDGIGDVGTQLMPTGHIKNGTEEMTRASGAYQSWINCRKNAVDRMNREKAFQLQKTPTGLDFKDPQMYYNGKTTEANTHNVPAWAVRTTDSEGKLTTPLEEKANEIRQENASLCANLLSSCQIEIAETDPKDGSKHKWAVPEFCLEANKKGIGLKNSTMDGVLEGPTGATREFIECRGTQNCFKGGVR